MQLIKVYLTGLFLLSASLGVSQNLFINPLPVEPILAGTFAEIRTNHFHSGIDIKTNESEGLPVSAAADGFISRLKVSASGFGNVLYIQHPGGYTTVYAHLHHFNDTLEKIAEAEMIRRQSFESELFFEPDRLEIKQGELIGYSGNTGGSSGPHLHFEIRDSKTEYPLNPMDLGFSVNDSIPPVIQQIMVSDFLPFNESYYPVNQTIIETGSARYDSVFSDTVSICGMAGIAVNVIDQMDSSSSKLGIKEILLLSGSDTLYRYTVKKFGFSETRYVNAVIDYEKLITENKIYILLYLLPGNRLSALYPSSKKGFIRLNDRLSHEFNIRVKDESENVSEKKVWLKKTDLPVEELKLKENCFIAFNKNPVAADEFARIDFSGTPVTYNIHDFTFMTKDSLISKYSKFVSAGDESIPVHTPFNLSIKISALDERLTQKAVIVKCDSTGLVGSLNGSLNSGWLSAMSRSFGNFYIDIDTVAPVIQSEGVSFDTLWMKQKLTYILTDNLSGINQYQMLIDGKWVPARFDAKSGKLTYPVPEGTPSVKRSVEIIVTDQKGNRNTLIEQFIF